MGSEESKMKVAIIGANGQLGADLAQQFRAKHDVTELTHEHIEITEMDSVTKVLKEIHPDVVLNTAAYHNVPKCEEEPMRSFQVNGVGALNLARASNDLDFKLVHFSTDYVFDGLKAAPYLEDDAPNPLNVYAATKLAGEYFVRNYSSKFFVVRVSGIYGKVPCRAKGGNFITTMIKLAKEKPVARVVDDEILTPTPTAEIANNTLALAATDAFGIYHMSCQGQCSWYQFAKVIFETLKLATPLEACSVKEFAAPVKRPHYSVLENSQLQKINLDRMPDWKESLINFLNGSQLPL
jgi:dTDP-4-dehydrorhamnose reductase